MRLTLAVSAVAHLFHVADSTPRSFAGRRRRRRRRDGGPWARRASGGPLIHELLPEAAGLGGAQRRLIVARGGDHGEEEEERREERRRVSGVREASRYESILTHVDLLPDQTADAEPAATENERLRKLDVDGINGTDVEVAREECDPESYDPDVGILSCGFGRHCDVYEASSLGGLCAPGSEDKNVLIRQAQRGLLRSAPGGLIPGCNPREDVLCLHDTVPVAGECASSISTNNEVLSCKNLCFDQAQTVCVMSLEGLYEIQNDTGKVSFCANFDRASGAPYARACFEYSAFVENNGDISYQCAISVDNRACACSPAACPVKDNNYGSDKNLGFQFDCTISNFCAKGNTCNGNRAPLFSLISSDTYQFIDCGTPKEEAPTSQPTAAIKSSSLMAPSAAQVLACPMVQIQIVTIVLGLLFQVWA